MASQFKIQIVHADSGVVYEWAPGQQVERDFIQQIVDRVAAEGVGVAKTQAQVLAVIKKAITDLLWELKADVRPTAG
jgi:hypothetical protein